MWFRRSTQFCPIYTPREFRGLIDKECRRADRFGSRFSLAIFEVGTRNANSVLIRRLVRTVHHRFRNTDDVGWYSDAQLGVILPFTPEEGAWKVAEYVSSVVASVTSPPAFTIYSYPSNRWPGRMLFGRWRVFEGLSGLLPLGAAQRAHKPEDLHALITRERSRADRSGQTFSLLVFRLDGSTGKRQDERRLVGVLNQRLRDTDEMGWYDDQHVGAILPYVAREDAIKLADSICRKVFGDVPPIYTVYTYPDSWFPPDITGEVDADQETAGEKRAARQRLPLHFPDAINEEGKDVSVQAMDRHGHFLYRPIPVWKRVLDVVGAGAAIVATSPILLVTAAVIRLVSPGPVFFRQTRIGYMRQPFMLLKFRTMHVSTDTTEQAQYMRKLIVEDGENKPMVKLERAQHLIPFGRFIRAACIDELPQLFNVARGDMSLVGPRPCLPYEADEYQRWHARRFDSLPGMSGLWQVSGKNHTTFKEMIRFDITYERRRSLLFDLKILLLTPWAVLKQLWESKRV